MNTNISTTPEQCQRLLACGVDPKSADIVWTTWNNDGEKLTQLSVMDESAYEVSCLNPIPAWSLSALLALLPKIITCDAYGYIWLEIVWVYEENSVPTIRYFTPPNENDDEPDQWEFTDESIIECAVQAVEWIKENGYKLNEI